MIKILVIINEVSVGVIMSSFGWNGGIDGVTKSPEEAAQLRRIMWRKDAEDRHEYRQQVIYALSRYIVDRMTIFDRKHKTNKRSLIGSKEWQNELLND